MQPPSRRRTFSDIENPSIGQPSLAICKFTVNEDDSRRFSGHLYVSEDLLKTPYAMIGSFPFKLALDGTSNKSEINFTMNQFYLIRDDFQTDFHTVGLTHKLSLPRILSCKLGISFSRDYKFSELSCLLLLEEIKKALPYPLPIGFRQSVELKIGSYCFVITCNELQVEGDERYGLITEETKLDFSLHESDKSLLLCDRVEKSRSTKFNVRVVLETLHDPYLIAPVIVKISDLQKGFFTLFQDNIVQKGLSKSHTIENLFTVSFNIASIESPYCLEGSKRRFNTAFEINRESCIQFSGFSSYIIIVDDQVYEATRIFFEVVAFNPSHDHARPAISLIEMKNALKERGPFVVGQKLFVRLKEGGATFLVKNIAEKILKTVEKPDLKKWYDVPSRNDFEFSKSYPVQATFIDHEELHPLKSMEIHVSRPVTIEEKSEIIQFIRENRRDCLREDDELTLVLKNKSEIQVTLHQFQFDMKPTTSFLGKLVNTTDIQLKYELAPEKPVEKTTEEIFREKEVVGLSKENMDFFKNLVAIMGPHKEKAKALKLTHEKGILFQGPPGTGKTSTAEALAACLGIQPSHIVKIKSSDIISKWMGEASKKIAALFDPARTAQVIEGENAPYRMIIFDELDSLTFARDSSESTNHIATVNALLGEMDRLRYLNLIVIGTTNKKDFIDSAFLRPGRFGTILHFDLPRTEERKEILSFYLNDIKDFLDSDVKIEELAEATLKMSGAVIKDIVNQQKIKLLKKDKVNRADFMESIKMHTEDNPRLSYFI